MRPTRLLYALAQSALRLVTPILAKRDSKLGVGLRGRRYAHESLINWGERGRDRARPTVWCHAPSVGEALQARAVMEAFREVRPETQFVFTYFSPSTQSMVANMGADLTGFLPWDLRSLMGPVLDAVQPELVVFTKTEVWPALVDESRKMGAKVCLVAGTLPAAAGRLRAPARAFLRPTWRALDAVYAVGAPDAERFEKLGARSVIVTGDPGIDSAAQRAGSADVSASYLACFREDPRPTLVAGSTWPSDEAVLVPALRQILDEARDVRVVFAPHEPTPGVVEGLVSLLQREVGEARSLREVERDGVKGVDAVVVDRIGVLAHLYTVGEFAYVGGGFHPAGLHSVLEPAAAGVPVLFGPGYDNAPAAGELLSAEGARVVHSADEVARAVLEWIRDDARRAYAGERALGYIDAHRGAAARTASLLSNLLNA